MHLIIDILDHLSKGELLNVRAKVLNILHEFHFSDDLHYFVLRTEDS